MASLPDAVTPEDMSSAVAQAREIVLRHGWNAVAYQVLNPGFKLWFSPDKDAVAGYVRCCGRWIVAGAPICARESLPEVANQLEMAAASDGCRVCYFGAALRLYENCSTQPAHSVVNLGAQPIWNPAHWEEMLSRRSSVRAQLHRAQNKGVIAAESPVISREQRAEMRQLLRTWISARTMPPMHFLVEPETLHHLEDRRVFTARCNGALVGFLIASPIPARNGWLVEQIIRHPQAPNGTNELLLHQMMITLAAEHCPYVTLGLVPLYQQTYPAGPPNPYWLSILFLWLRAHGRRFYNFVGLSAFKSKFQPDAWEPIFAITTEPRFSPRTLWAVAAAFSHCQSPLVHGSKAMLMAVRQELGRIWF